MKRYLPGLLLSTLIALTGILLAQVIPLGSVTLAILIGIIIRNTVPLSAALRPGIAYSEKKILSWAIALIGFSLDYRIFADLGMETLLIIFLGVPFTILVALAMGRIFGLEKETSLLLGVGNGICGSSAIAAAQTVIQTDEEHVGVSVATINLLGAVGIFLLPALSLLLPGFMEQQQGILIGNTLQAVGQVSAAGYSVSEAVGETATIVKMGRILLITPVVMILAAFRKGDGERRTFSGVNIPGYLIFFLLFSLINSTGILPTGITSLLSQTGKYLLTVAMAGIGLSISTAVLKTGGRKTLLTGVSTWVIQIVFSVFLVTVLSAA